MKTKFYLFRQINSGGFFLRDKQLGVDAQMLIEAYDEDQALDIFQRIGDSYGEDDFRQYCDCCGYRWDFEVNDQYEVIPDWVFSDGSTSIIMLSGKIIRVRQDEKEETLTFRDS